MHYQPAAKVGAFYHKQFYLPTKCKLGSHLICLFRRRGGFETRPYSVPQWLIVFHANNERALATAHSNTGVTATVPIRITATAVIAIAHV